MECFVNLLLWNTECFAAGFHWNLEHSCSLLSLKTWIFPQVHFFAKTERSRWPDSFKTQKRFVLRNMKLFCEYISVEMCHRMFLVSEFTWSMERKTHFDCASFGNWPSKRGGGGGWCLISPGLSERQSFVGRALPLERQNGVVTKLETWKSFILQNREMFWRKYFFETILPQSILINWIHLKPGERERKNISTALLLVTGLQHRECVG